MANNHNKNALLIGNGINQLDSNQSLSWSQLLTSLKIRFNIQVDLDNEFKPFPIGFEEMMHLKDGSNNLDDKLKNLKQEITYAIRGQLNNKLGYNQYHKKITNLEYDDILTTNYDYALELSIDRNFFDSKRKYALNRQERKYSLKRCYRLPNLKTKFWHIHGELYDSRKISDASKNYHEESIMIGYEHYAAYLENIQENVSGSRKKRILDIQVLNTRIKSNKTGIFWTDVFFTHDMDIIGLGLDFSENHLWWLLSQRATAIRKVDEGSINNTSFIPITNIITYYYPDMQNTNRVIDKSEPVEKIISRVNGFKKSKAIAEVLQSFKVVPKAIRCTSYEEFYDKFLSIKENNM